MLFNTGWHVPPFWHFTFKQGFYENKNLYLRIFHIKRWSCFGKYVFLAMVGKDMREFEILHFM